MGNIHNKNMMQNVEVTAVAQELIETSKAEVTAAWFAAVAEQNAKRKSFLLEQYRSLKRRYELQASLAA